VDKLPEFIQPISWMIPTTYILESMREIIAGNYVPTLYIIASSVLNIIWLTASIWYFKRSFINSKELGLNRFN